MKTKVLAALVATMAVGATCAFAANPFVDVPTDSWAYKSVVELADAGIIQGVDGTYFQGDRNITRYEAAEMTAKAMAHMDKASVEQRALINKLADEYADELNSLGVRVSNLENKVGNVKLTGDARIRYRFQNNAKENDDSWQYRIRLRANAQVNDRTKVTYGISSNNQTFSQNGAASGGDTNDEDIYTDLANIDYNFGGNNWDLMVGRYTYILGDKVGYQFGDAFDGAQLQYKNDKFKAIAGFGKFKEGDLAGVAKFGNTAEVDGVKTGYGELEGFFGGGSFAGSSVGAYYNDFYGQKGFTADDLWGGFASFNFGQKWNLTANYEKINDDATDDPDMWYGKLQYGTASFAAPKSWDAWVEYLNAEDGAFLNGSTNMWRWAGMDNIKTWGVGVDYTFAKNAMFSVMQSFASEAKDNSKDPEELTRAQFVFVF
ncbi:MULTISPECIES: S-layer homology domain-containing protein [unclassified Megasphaera]|uniref:S-layer homology domain-containing protein n=1 Tax=unclassified Megasphaera TaxID=2626256 RepID=UPI0025C5F560|nr:S-layer homology domain-containing protein [Megasphaera sp. UBA4233]